MEYFGLTKNTNTFGIIVLLSIILVISLIIYNCYKANQFVYFDCGCGKNISENTPKIIQGFDNTNNVNCDEKHKIILYYANWCGHSRNFLPEWEKLKKEIENSELKNVIVAQQYECDKDKKMCEQNNIRGFPTMILHKINGDNVNYQNERTVESILDFIRKNI
jgi:Thioredoxin domain-containing protein